MSELICKVSSADRVSMLSRAQAAVYIQFYGIGTESDTLITTYSLLGMKSLVWVGWSLDMGNYLLEIVGTT